MRMELRTRTIVLAGLWMVSWHLVACDGPEKRPGPTEEQTSAMTKGLPIFPANPGTVQYTDTIVLTEEGCRGTLLTNSWVLTAQHCEAAYQGRTEFVYYEQACTLGDDSACLPRNAHCIRTFWGDRCGMPVKQVHRNPKSNSDPGLGNQVDLWQLESPIYADSYQRPYSIAQQIYNGTKSSLENKNITIIGHCAHNCEPQLLLARWDFNVSDVSSIYSYGVTGFEGAVIERGDSGGPGYYFGNSGIQYLTGVTMTVGTQHDLAETWSDGGIYDWIDDTMFHNPQYIQPQAQGLAMALTDTGAVQAFLKDGVYYFSQCDSEPCDARGIWSTPGWFLSGRTAPPAIAIDELWGTTGAQVFVGDSSGITAYALAWGAYLGSTELGGSCSSPAGVDSRPGTSPPILDVTCRGQDGNLYINQRVDNVYGGYYSLGQPSAGILPGVAPAVVSTDSNTTYVAVVGSDGDIYVQPGQGGQGWMGWSSIGKPSGRTFRSVALASYEWRRLDVVAIDSYGTMWHRIGTGAFSELTWSQSWTPMKGDWAHDIPPYAAARSSRLGLMNVGGVSPGGGAFVMRYSDW